VYKISYNKIIVIPVKFYFSVMELCCGYYN